MLRMHQRASRFRDFSEGVGGHDPKPTQQGRHGYVAHDVRAQGTDFF